MSNPTCRIKPDASEAFELPLVKGEDGWELRDPTGKLPLDAFDLINEELNMDDESGRVHSEERDTHYAWEIIDPDATV